MGYSAKGPIRYNDRLWDKKFVANAIGPAHDGDQSGYLPREKIGGRGKMFMLWHTPGVRLPEAKRYDRPLAHKNSRRWALKTTAVHQKACCL
jgi:hypothetical protein